MNFYFFEIKIIYILKNKRDRFSTRGNHLQRVFA